MNSFYIHLQDNVSNVTNKNKHINQCRILLEFCIILVNFQSLQISHFVNFMVKVQKGSQGNAKDYKSKEIIHLTSQVTVRASHQLSPLLSKARAIQAEFHLCSGLQFKFN